MKPLFISAFSRRPKAIRQQRGAVAIIVGISMAVLVGFVGLALDAGKLYVAKTELQNSADACALAAAQDLTGANQLAVSEAAGMTAGAVHRVLFQAEDIALAEDSNVTFSAALDGTYYTKANISAAEANFVRCTVERAQIPTWFMQVLNVMPGIEITATTVRATAVASLVPAQTNCALPVAICNTAVPPGTAPGTWIEGAIGPSGGESSGGGGLTGNFKWVDFTPPGGGASELAEELTGSGTCNLPSVGSEVGQPGVIASAANDWNSRFGIYQGNVRPADAIPDYTGHGYTEVSWPPQFNAYGDFRGQRAANAPYQGDTATGLRTNGTTMGASFLSSNGADRRLAIAPVVDCDEFAEGSTAPVERWVCLLLLHPINNSAGGPPGTIATGRSRMFLEYRGRSDDLDSPCASIGIPGDLNSLGPQVPVLVQ